MRPFFGIAGRRLRLYTVNIVWMKSICRFEEDSYVLVMCLTQIQKAATNGSNDRGSNTIALGSNSATWSKPGNALIG